MNNQLESIKKSIDNYITTVNALLCFLSLTSWINKQPTKHFFCSFGRNMTTGPNNPVSPDTNITPDEIIQLSNSLGLIIEAKIGLPQAKELWMDIETQLRKYDDDLRGWWTEDGRIPRWNSIFLVEIARSEEFKEFREKLISDGVFSADNNIVGIEFSRADQFNTYIFFRTRWGNIHDSALGEVLRLGKKKDIQDAENYYGRIKFCDSPPEPEYLLSIIWQDIFTPLHRSVEYSKSLKCYPIDITISRIVHELQLGFGSKALQRNCGIDAYAEREVEYPQTSWVRDSLSILEKLGLAKRISEDSFKIYFKRLKVGDLISYFTRARKKREGSLPSETMQKSLFPEGDL